MDRDPVEREKEFRRRVEGAALAEREARLRRTRPWRPLLKGLGSIFFKLPWLLSLVFVLLVGGLVFLLFFSLHIKWTEAYACSLSEARRHATVIAELGEPVEAGLFAWTPGYAREGSVTDTSFSTGLRGPRGEGTLSVRWYSSPVGSSLQLELEKEGRRHLLYRGPIPCR